MRLILASLFILTTSILSAQLNEAHIYVDAQTHVLEELNINSILIPDVSADTATDSLGFTLNPIGNQYKLHFKSEAGYTGDITAVIEYTEPSFLPGIPQTNYTTVHFRVKNSKITARNDFALSDGSTLVLHPLANDNSSNGSLSITKLGHVSGGSATISSDQTIDFDLAEDEGQILYFTEDSIGTVASSLVHIINEDDTRNSSKDLFIDNRDQIQIILSAEGFQVATAAVHGTLVQNATSHVWTYTPDAGYSGTDEFSFTTVNGGLMEYQVAVLNKTESNSFVVDDEVFVTTDGTITFDVLANDFRSDLNVFYQSPELTELSNGLYEFTPAPGFTGDLNFEYKVFTGLQLFVGNILVHVSDFAPTTSENYTFEIVEDQPLRIVHNTPTSDYTFQVAVEPTNGSVVVLDEFNQAITSCDTINGSNTILYFPDAGFSGTDEFDIEYCTTTGTILCEIVKVDINVLTSSNTDCLCLTDCVFQGDHNDDGRVDIKDILDLGLNIGEGGGNRAQDFNEIWTGQYSGNWGHSQMNSQIDLKCGDSDGDGYIDEDDISAIEQFYGKLSRFQTQVSSAISDVPVYFVPQQTEVDSGELLVLDIVIGDSSFPAIDFSGLAFSFNIDPTLIDSSSVNFYLYEDSWMGYNSPVKEFSYVPQDGQVDIAITRYGNGSADGIGIIGALEFIVEDEINGFKRAANYLALSEIKMSGILSVNQDGEYHSHPDVIKTVEFGAEGSTSESATFTANSVTVYPNPTKDIVNIYSKHHSIDKIEVYDALGRMLTTHTKIGQTVSLSDLDNGLYFLRMHSGEKTITKKIHKVSL